MPTKGLRPSLARTHSRSSSGGSSKMVLNLQLTHKDPVQSKIDKARRAASHALEPTARANVSRTGSTVHVQHQTAGAAPRRATNPHTPRGGKLKAGFTIAASTVGSDEEDEWVESESGAATPMDDDASGDEGSSKKTPEELSPPTPVDPAQRAKGPHVPGTTPRTESAPPRPRVQTNGFTPTHPHHVNVSAARVTPPSEPSRHAQWQRGYHQQPKQPNQQPDASQQPHSQAFPLKSPASSHEGVPVVYGAHTEPPTPTSPRSGHHPIHRPRPSSTRSFIADHALRPHPLIRGQSFGHGHLAPLKVTSDAAQAQLSSSPPPCRAPSTSPTSIRTVHTPVQTVIPGKHFSNAIFRRPSTSSTNSVATLPVQPLTPVERGRTISTASSSAVLSLAHLPTRGTAASSQTAPLVVHFPPQNMHAHPETVHTLLPPPYVTPHFTILQWRSPISESHDRVAHARGSQRRRHGA
ncbi:hypothetical protein F5148DRAFT_1214862 [Russula earlei]|uniref:Uncharacterized protein n=1 Tax=Russula earlei TaxID=71964 RepID=A0ACC0U430_9AGAM|nr:hypothetical protein F5148DRAFT_1214862 [Russula earlei]